MSAELAIRQTEVGLPLADRKRRADDEIELATHWAQSLMKVVNKCGLAKDIQDKKYLEVEGWQIIGEFAHVTAIPEWTREWMNGEGLCLGYEARVKLVHVETGDVVGAGESSCGFDAFPCKNKEGSERDKAARSAAQTWAISKAFRNKFSYVAKLAGFEPTPAEEMTSTFSDYPILNECPLHKEPWKDGKWGKYHYIKSGGSCNLANLLQAELKKAANAANKNAEATGEWLREQGYPMWQEMSYEQRAETIVALSALKESEPGAQG